MNKPQEEVLQFMKTDEYTDLPFTKFVKKFGLEPDELKNLLRIHMEDDSIRILEWSKDHIIVG